MKKTWKLAICALAITLSLAACSAKDDSPKTDDPDPTEQPSGDVGTDDPAATNGKKETVTDVDDPQGSVEGYVGAKEDATLDTCETKDGALEVKGSVTNPVDSTQDYRIYVSAMEGADTRGIVQIDVAGVEANATEEWSTDIALGDEGLTCLLRVERFAPQG